MPDVRSKIEVADLPFEEQIRHLKDKVRVPTKKWTDIWQGAHTRAFVVAGATKEELLCDFQSAIIKALETGSTLQDFRRDFDETVARHGWSYKGGRNWRSRVIFETNLRTSYQAARFEQMKELGGERPYWRYRHGDSRKPRKEHLAWDGLVLRYDDPWWKTHYPPNGWGCRCTVVALTESEMKALGKEHPDQAPKEKWQRAPAGSPVSRTPKGIDPGWAYNVGEAAVGQVKMLSAEEMKAKWEPIDVLHTTASGLGLPAIRPDKPIAELGRHAVDVRHFKENTVAAIGGEQAVFELPTEKFRIPVTVDAGHIAGHMDTPEKEKLLRSPYVTRIPELLTDPAEIWATFVRHPKSGQVGLRLMILKRFDDPKKNDGLVMVANVVGGKFVDWTFYPTKKINDRLRGGRLIYRRDK